MKIAVVTGTASNLLKEFILEISKHFNQVQQIWVIGKKVEKLSGVRKFVHNKIIKIIPLDLSLDESYNEYKILLNKYKPRIKLLINCTCIEKNTNDFDKSTYNKQIDIFNLNCKSVVTMSKLSIPYMYSGSCIINISSVLAFLPLPKMVVYSAAKSFVLNFSKALNKELKSKGIKVTVVLPKLNLTDDLYNKTKFGLFNDCKTAELAIKSSIKSKDLVIEGIAFKLLAIITKIIPYRLFVKLYRY